MNEIIISNIPPQNININEGGVTGITTVYVNGVDVTVGNNAYVLVPTKLSELQNDTHFITQESDPTVPTWVKAISISDINNWNSKQNQLTAGTNIEINDNVISAPLTDYVKFTDYADYGKAGVIKPQSGSGEASLTYYGFGVADNGQPFAYAARSYIGYDRLHFNAFISKETLETAIEGKELTNKTYVDSANTLQDNEISNLKSENNYLNSIINQLPKESSQGTILTLNNTINGRMNIELGSRALEQETTTGKNLANIYVISSLTVEAFKRVVADDKIVISNNTNTSGFMTTEKKLNQICPNLQVGDNATLTYTTTWSSNYIYLDGYNQVWINDSTKTITQEMLDSVVIMYGGYNQTTTISNFMIRLSSITDATYEPYTNGPSPNPNYPQDIHTISGSNKVVVSDGNGNSQEANIDLGDIEYCKIGNYEDKFIRESDGTWKLEKNIGKVVLDGSETNWNIYGTGTSNWFYYLPLTAESTTALCNNYSYNMITGSNTNEGFYLVSNYLRIRYGTEDTLENYKTWLSTHNTNVYYPLATPEYTQITGTLAEQLENVYQKLLSYKGQTNISQINNDLPFVISASALLDLNTLVGE